MAIPIAVAPADANPYLHHASEDRTDQPEEVFDRGSLHDVQRLLVRPRAGAFGLAASCPKRRASYL